MTVVLDVSVAVDIVLCKPGTEAVKKVVAEADAVIVPDLFVSEVSNVAWKYWKILHFSHEQAGKLAEGALFLVDRYLPAADLWREALSEAIRHDHSVYDLLYIIAARRNDALLLSRDRKLLELAERLDVEVFRG